MVVVRRTVMKEKEGKWLDTVRRKEQQMEDRSRSHENEEEGFEGIVEKPREMDGRCDMDGVAERR